VADTSETGPSTPEEPEQWTVSLPESLRVPWTSAPTEPTTEKYDPGKHRELTRARLAAGLVGLLGVLALLLVVLTCVGCFTVEEAKDLATIVFSPIVVLTGTALGFYFGVQQNGR
jgi:hypothetical protein